MRCTMITWGDVLKLKDLKGLTFNLFCKCFPVVISLVMEIITPCLGLLCWSVTFAPLTASLLWYIDIWICLVYGQGI